MEHSRLPLYLNGDLSDFFRSANWISGGAQDDALYGTIANDVVLSDTGNDTVLAGDGDDILLGQEGNDYLSGGDGNDAVVSGFGNDVATGGMGDDLMMGEAGDDLLYGDEGSDVLIGGQGFDSLFGGEGEDWIYGGRNNDFLFGEEGKDTLSGDEADDVLIGGSGDDVLIGGTGSDQLVDGSGNDVLFGGSGKDAIHSFLGADFVEAGEGNDTVVSRSDGGEPIPMQTVGASQSDRVNNDTLYLASDDHLTGGNGADIFYFRLDINAKAEIAAKHTDEHGMINWMGVAGENNDIHDHWVESIGSDVIADFDVSEDQLIIDGHTVNIAIINIDADHNGSNESALIFLFSNQGVNGGAHHMDDLGTIVVEGVTKQELEEADVIVNAHGHHGAFETLAELEAGWWF